MAVEGLTTIPSRYGPKEAIERLEAEVKETVLLVSIMPLAPRMLG